MSGDAVQPRPRRRALQGIGAVLLEALREWVRDRCDGLAAAMAFNAVLAAAPFVAFMMMLAAAVFGVNWAEAHVLPALTAWVGPQGAAVLRLLIFQHEQITREAIITLNVASAAGLVIGASGFFLQMQDGLQTIWNVRREDARVLAQLAKRLQGLLYALASAVIALAGPTGAGLIFSFDSAARPALLSTRPLGESAIAFLVFWALVGFWLRMLPPVRVGWRHILPWSALIALMHVLGRAVLTWRAASRQTDAAEAIILVLLWFYYATMVFLYGAQVMKVYLLRYKGAHLAEAPPPPRATW